MLRKLLTTFALVLATAAFANGQATQPSTQPTIDATADKILKESCDFLAKTHAFSVHAEIWKDEALPSGHKIEVTRTVALELSRPNHLHVEAKAHHKGRSIWYDGKTLTVMDRENSLYGVVDAPATVDESIDFLSEKYGITVPLEDLVVSDPYASSMKKVTAGGYFGDETVLGVPCRHIGFSTDLIDWQLWVADGPQPLPQKLVITYKTEDLSPQFTAIFTKWEILDRASEMVFEFIPPRGSSRIPLVAQTPKEHP